MKQIKLVTIFLVLFISTGSAQGIVFENNADWRQILARAKEQNKFIFVDAYTTWCGPCKVMSQQTFPKKEVGDYINGKFIAVQIQMDQTRSDNPTIKAWYADARMIEQQYEIHAYPTILFISPDGKLISRLVGYQDAENLLREANKVIELNGEYGVLLNELNKGLLDTAALKKLAKKSREYRDYRVGNQIATAYYKKLSKKDLLKKESLMFIGRHMMSDHPYFKRFMKNPDKINKIVTKNFVENEIMRVIYLEEIEPFDKLDKPNWDVVESKIIMKYGALGQERVWGSRLVYYEFVGDWDNFGKYYKLYFQRSVENERSFLHINNLSWSVFEHVTDSSVIKLALKTMKYNIEKFDTYDPRSIDTYGNLLYKAFVLHNIGKKEDAIGWYELAVKLSEHDKFYVSTLEKMERGERTWQ